MNRIDPMLLADAITCRVPTPDAIKIESLTCSSSIMDTVDGVEILIMWLSLFVSAGMALFAFLAWNNAQTQLRDLRNTRRRDEIRTATHDFIRAVHDLRRFAFIPETNIDLYRSAAGQELILFRIVIGDGLDRDKLFMLTDTAIKASGIAHTASQPGTSGVQKSHKDFIHRTVNPIINGLELFDRGTLPASKLADHIEKEMKSNLDHPHYYGDSKIRPALKQAKFPIA